MNQLLTNMEEILESGISGFHQYALTSQKHIVYVSKSLTEMTGFTAEDLLHETEDRYVLMVHASDRERYLAYINDAARTEKSSACEYRLVKKDGSVIHVRDNMSVVKSDDGCLYGNSVLTDITDIRSATNDLQFLNDTIPCGFLRYSCEKQPRITYINQTMIDLLRFPAAAPGEMDYLEMYKSNIFLMIPMEERRRFSKYLNRVFSAEAPIAGELTLLRCDGTRAHVFGWVTKHTNEKGEPEFQSVCMDVTERHKSSKDRETRRYLKALTDVYDKIFEFNRDANTVKCLHCEDDSTFKRFEDIAMQIDDALEKWIIGAVKEEYRENIRTFFRNFIQYRQIESDGTPPQIEYFARSSSGEMCKYSGLFIKVDESVSFYCCRRVQDDDNTVSLKIENDQLRERMKELVMRFSDGIAAFEISPDGGVKPLYASENVYEFFGYTPEEWLTLTERYTPIEHFVAYSEASYEDFETLLKNGESEFSYFDYHTENERRIKAVCSQKEPDSNSPRYVMLYLADDTASNLRETLSETRTVSVRTFGYFDVFVGDKPIAFRNKKSKELLALLVDRRGGYVTSEEAIAYLWEDEPVNTVTLSRYRKVALRLKNTLEEYGIADVVESVDGKRRIASEKVECDLYNYLSGKEEYSQLFKGSYLTNYSWAENTLGELMNNQM